MLNKTDRAAFERMGIALYGIWPSREVKVALKMKNKAVDLVTLTEALKSKGTLEAVGGAVYLTELTAAVPTAANIQHYAKIVKEKGILRSLINIATQIVTEGYGGQQEAGTLLDKAEKQIFEIAGSRLKGISVSIKDIIKDSIETIEGCLWKYRR